MGIHLLFMPSAKDKDNYQRSKGDVELKNLALLDGDGHEQLYQGQQAHHRAGCCSRLCFSWVNPMIRVVNKNEKIVMAQLGELHESERLEAALPVLEAKWNEAVNSKAKGDILFRTVFTAYKWQYLNVLFWNVLR